MFFLRFHLSFSHDFSKHHQVCQNFTRAFFPQSSWHLQICCKTRFLVSVWYITEILLCCSCAVFCRQRENTAVNHRLTFWPIHITCKESFCWTDFLICEKNALSVRIPLLSKRYNTKWMQRNTFVNKSSSSSDPSLSSSSSSKISDKATHGRQNWKHNLHQI